MLGLGRMGGNMSRRLLRAGHRVVMFDREPAIGEAIKAEMHAGEAAARLADLRGLLAPPRHAWMMLPAGEPTESVLTQLLQVLEPGDTVVDGGNANYQDTQRRVSLAQTQGLQYVDVGVSGGVWGLSVGYGMMIGGDREAVERLRPVFEALAPAPDKGWARAGACGAGHYAKMVHNGIEYGMMQALAEGLDILHAKTEFEFDLPALTEAWRYGTVIRSWLLDLAAAALADDPQLSHLEGYVADSGEGRWTVQEALALDVPAPVITTALFHRFYSRNNGAFASKLLAAMRKGFGGHAVKAVVDAANVIPNPPRQGGM
jgi:6-phosphogluconate dehydrogenase